MSDHQVQQAMGGGRLSLVTTTGFLVAAILLFFILFVFAFFLFLRTKHYWGTIPGFGQARPGVLATAAAESAAATRVGLDPAAVKSLASFVFRPEDFREGLECSVCLSELSEGEAARLLPKCGHGFHLQCIDMWFRSHSTCPLCRSSVIAGLPESAISGVEIVEVRPPEAVAGDESPTASSSHILTASSILRARDATSSSPASSAEQQEMLVIDVLPRRAVEMLPSPISPLHSTVLGSLRRFLMIYGRARRASDIEQGGGLSVPKPRPASS